MSGLFAPESVDDIRERLAQIEETGCACLVTPHENALHDLAHDDVPWLLVALEAAETDRDRFRSGLQAIAADYDRNKWHPDTKFPPAGRHWHDGYITLAAHHSLLAGKYLDPEGSAESEHQWRLGAIGTDAEWWIETGHCGGCGLVGSSCDCSGECGCADLHGPRLPDWKPVHVLLAEVTAERDALRAKIAALTDPEVTA